jgi:thiol-disulfide isomerase/thioredoxin
MSAKSLAVLGLVAVLILAMFMIGPLSNQGLFLLGEKDSANNVPGENAFCIIGEDCDGEATEGYPVTIYFFWGEGCPHCDKQKPFLEEMGQKYPTLKVEMFETRKSPENSILFSDIAKAYGTTARGVPATFIGDFEPFVGFADYMKPDMEKKIAYCVENGCISPDSKLN